MLRQFMLAWSLVLMLGACALPQESPPVVPTLPESAQADLEALHQELSLVHQDLATLNARLETVDTLTPRVVMLEQIQATLKKMPKNPTRTRAPVDPTPLQLVTMAAKEAVVQPTDKCFYGGSAECTYIFQTGRIYPIYLTPAHSTSISLPPGERYLDSLVLEPEEFTVKNLLGGQGDGAYSVLSIHPKITKASIQTVLLTESGRRYLLQLL